MRFDEDADQTERAYEYGIQSWRTRALLLHRRHQTVGNRAVLMHAISRQCEFRIYMYRETWPGQGPSADVTGDCNVTVSERRQKFLQGSMASAASVESTIGFGGCNDWSRSTRVLAMLTARNQTDGANTSHPIRSCSTVLRSSVVYCASSELVICTTGTGKGGQALTWLEFDGAQSSLITQHRQQWIARCFARTQYTLEVRME